VDEQWLPDEEWDEADRPGPGSGGVDEVYVGPCDGGTLAWSRSGATVHIEIIEVTRS